MKSEIENAIKTILAKITDKIAAHEALHLTQSALNLAHTQQVIETK